MAMQYSGITEAQARESSFAAHTLLATMYTHRPVGDTSQDVIEWAARQLAMQERRADALRAIISAERECLQH